MADSLVFSFSGPENPDNPTANFTTTTNGLVVTVDGALSQAVQGEIVSWSWSFGDGETGTGLTTAHTYAVAGTYPITLTVVDSNGLSGNITKNIIVGGVFPWGPLLLIGAGGVGIVAYAATRKKVATKKKG